MKNDGQEIRTSQALHTYGPGAIADFPELSVMILSHDIVQRNRIDNAPFWGEDAESPANKLEDERLSVAFKVSFFVSPPLADSAQKASIQSTRFPTILQCPVTGQLFDSRKLEKDDKFYTDYSSRERKTVDETFRGFDSPNARKRKLIPIRFIIATENGHIDNFPFDWYVHIKNNKPEQIGRGNILYLKSKGDTASLKNLWIESYTADKKFVCKVSLERIFDQEDTFADIDDPSKDYLQFVSGRMPKPWKGRNDKTKDFNSFPIDDVKWPPYNDSTSDRDKKDVLSKYPRTIQRGAGNLYFPIIYKGISIPKSGYSSELPEDFISAIQFQIRNLKSMGMLTAENQCEEFVKVFRSSTHKNTTHLGYTIDQSVKMIRDYFSNNEIITGQYTISQLRQQEFSCFTNPNVTAKKEEWYNSNVITGAKYNLGKKGFVKQVVLLNKLRELKIFRGFTRIKPLMFDDLIFESGDGVGSRKKRESFRIQDPRVNSATETLPATEVKGEGIFIQFDNKLLKNWENQSSVKERFLIIERNYNNYRNAFELDEDNILSARYIALHTFSHLLINELAIECGYGSSSLSEIIYCNSETDQDQMNGILIYTSSSDSEGTLGGLVEKGDSTLLNSIAEKALSKAKWCSSDPLCIENRNGKGFMGVNLAACHSCCLLPETSCSNMNKFLDRGLVIGVLDNPKLGLFTK